MFKYLGSYLVSIRRNIQTSTVFTANNPGHFGWSSKPRSSRTVSTVWHYSTNKIIGSKSSVSEWNLNSNYIFCCRKYKRPAFNFLRQSCRVCQNAINSNIIDRIFIRFLSLDGVIHYRLRFCWIIFIFIRFIGTNSLGFEVKLN